MDLLQGARLALHVLAQAAGGAREAALQLGALAHRLGDVALGRLQRQLGVLGVGGAVGLLGEEGWWVVGAKGWVLFFIW